MSKPLVDAASDDEFQDALSDIISDKEEFKEKTNEKVVEEVFKEFNIDINDDDAKLGSSEGAKSVENEETVKPKYIYEDINEAAVFNEETVQPKNIDEDINEEAMREAEKSLTTEELEINKEKANDMKLEANDLFKNDDAEEAIKIYTQALKTCPTIYPKDRAVLYGNRAAAKMKLDSNKSALDDCSQAIELWPDYVRARIRRAKLYENDDKLELALDDYKHVYELDPYQIDARNACVRLPPIINQRNEKLKEEMMGKFKDLGNIILKPFGLSTSNFQMQQDPKTGSYSINFNQK